jgi:hypothetical protein
LDQSCYEKETELMKDDNRQAEDSSQGQKKTSRKAKLWGALRQAARTAGQISGQAIRKGAQVGGKVARGISQTTQDTVGKVQRKLGEDYYTILAENPVVANTMSRADLLVEDNVLLSTAFNIPWTTTLLWSAAAGSVVALQRPIADTMGQFLHYGPGHIETGTLSTSLWILLQAQVIGSSLVTLLSTYLKSLSSSASRGHQLTLCTLLRISLLLPASL